MRLQKSINYRRTEDAGSSGCPPEAVGCNANPEEHDLAPAQASSLSQSLAASSASATATATLSLSNSATNPDQKNVVDPQVVGGVIVIVFLVLAFTTTICYIAFGARGERCCCTSRKNKRRKMGQMEGTTEAAPEAVKAGSEVQLVQKA